MLQRFAIADLSPTPWKNGGGSTREIVCRPPGAGMDGFDWRVSIATIAQSGPFSVFAGVDRVILLLDGDGVRLQSADGIDHRLDQALQPFAFSGDEALDCTLLGGPSQDFNVMTRRSALRAEVSGAARTNPPGAGAPRPAARGARPLAVARRRGRAGLRRRSGPVVGWRAARAGWPGRRVMIRRCCGCIWRLWELIFMKNRP